MTKRKLEKFALFVGNKPGQADKFVPVAFETFGGFKETRNFILNITWEVQGQAVDSNDIINGLTKEIAMASSAATQRPS